MAKIGTAHVEVKPVLNEEALEVLTEMVEKAVRDGVQRGLSGFHEGSTPKKPRADFYGDPLTDGGAL